MTQPARYRHSLFNLAVLMRTARRDAEYAWQDAEHALARVQALVGRRDALDSRVPLGVGTTSYWTGYNRELGVDGYLNRSHRRWLGDLDKPTTNDHGSNTKGTDYVRRDHNISSRSHDRTQDPACLQGPALGDPKGPPQARDLRRG